MNTEANTIQPNRVDRLGGVRFSWHSVAIVVSTIFLVVMIGRHFANLWEGTHYQYFPFVLLAVGYFVWLEREKISVSDTTVRFGTRPILVVSIAFLFLGVAVNSAWACTTSLVLLLGVVVWNTRSSRLLGIWSLLWLVIPPPLGFDQSLIIRLQLLSSTLSSEILDLLGLNHLMTGNVLRVADKRFFVDEACSGIVSIMSVVATAAIYAVFKRRSVIHGCILVLSGIGWATLMNVVRISIIPWAHVRWKTDLAEGAMHETLGMALFIVTFLAMLSTDQLLCWCLAPIRTKDVNRNVFVDLWNRLFGKKSSSGSSEILIDRKLISSQLLSSVFGFAAIVAVFLAWVDSDRFQLNGTSTIEELQAKIDGDTLTSDVANWKVASFEPGVEGDDVFAFRSKRFELANADRRATVSFDFPFVGPWHELTDCYRYAGWRIKSREVRNDIADGVDVVVAELVDDEDRTAILFFALFDDDLEYALAPIDASWDALRRRLSPRTLLSRMEKLGLKGYSDNTLYQVQLFAPGMSGSDLEAMTPVFTTALDLIANDLRRTAP